MDKTRYQAIIFDLDGVITDTARYHFLAWKRLAESLNIQFDEVFNESLKGIDRKGSLELILGSAGKFFTDEKKLALTTEKNTHYLQLITTMSASDLLPGALDTLKSVRAAGLKVGLASASKNAFMVLDKLGIADLFDYVVDASMVANGKPDPEIFLTAAKHLMTSPSNCLGVEDSVAGIQSIKSAGMYALGIGNPTVLTQADKVIPSLSDFRLRHYCKTTDAASASGLEI